MSALFGFILVWDVECSLGEVWSSRVYEGDGRKEVESGQD